MPTTYSSLLGLAIPASGELYGTWGQTINNYITQYLDASVAGTQTISGSQTAVTLSITNGTALSQVGSGSTGSSQYQIINCTGNPASLLTITAPYSSKSYIVINATSTSQSVKIVGVGPTAGVTIVSGERAIVAWNGTDFVKVGSTLTNLASVTGTLATANGGTGLTSFTANGVVYASSSSALTTGSALSFTGTQFTSTVQSSFGGAVGSESLRATPVASAVNYVNVQGATTGNAPSISATGSNTNVGLTFSVKGQAPVTFTSTDASVASYGIELGDGNSGSRQTYIDFHSSPSTDYDLRIVRNVGANGTAQYINAGAAGHRFNTGGGLQFEITHTASAVNYWNLYGAATTGYPTLQVLGTDTNIGFVISAKGTGPGVFQSDSTQFQNIAGQAQFLVTNTPSAVNYVQASGGTTGNAANIAAQGSDTNVDLNLISKGTGVVEANGLPVVTTTGTQTLTNKRVNPRVNNNGATTTGSITPTGDSSDQFELLGLTGAITVAAPSGTPVAGQKLTLRFKDNGTARGITWTTTSGAYRAIGVTLPTTTVISKNLYVGCIYNATDVFWDVVAVAQEA